MNERAENIQRELVCINCPRGCVLTVTGQGDAMSVSGNSCARGIPYAKQELEHPMRVLTALMRPADESRPISVKTDRPVPKDMLFACAQAIYAVHPEGSVHPGDILIENLCGTGSNVIATRGTKQ